MGAAVPVERADAMTLDRFRARTETFLFAGRRDNLSDLVYLNQGTAEQQRTRARTELRCPEPACSAPEITTVNRATSGWRDGYRHLVRPVDNAHAPESLLHRQGKALVARWAATHPAVETAEMEVRLGDGERVADVLLTSRAGNRLAVEIQYAGITALDWIERTESYERLGIPVVWFFGSTGTMSPLRDAFRQVHKQTLTRQRPLLWINPVEEMIGWPVCTATERLPAPDDGPTSTVQFCGLDNLELRATGLYPPGFLELRTQMREVEAAAQQRAANRDRVQRERIREMQAAAAKRFASVPPPRRSAPQTKAPDMRPRCQVCGLRLDPILYEAGRHYGC